ncbi:hypothetical protein HYS47_02695 [Candidatus Woesearchaeota archaeon]|nr:hypothetical protein [Candidatus Woesearchaeota archaeon]
MADVTQYKYELMESLRAAGDAFDAVGYYRPKDDEYKNKEKELLGKALDAMPVFAQAIAVIDAIPPRRLTELVKDNIVHRSIASEHQAKRRFVGEIRGGRMIHRLSDTLKTYYLSYLKGELSLDNDQSLLYLIGPYTFENMARTCRSALRICENVDSIDNRMY